jgi:3-oxoacyl-[acyl-carrier-protein] synthase II
MSRRVAVTGLGVVSPVGIGADSAWESIAAGKSGIAAIEHFDASEYTTRIAGYVSDFDPSVALDKKEARRMSRFQQMAIVAADEAVADSGLVIDDSNADRVGVIIGSGIGGLQLMEEQHVILLEKGPSRLTPFTVPMMIADLAAGHVSMRLGAKGINYCPISACATGNTAIGEAGEAIRRGTADAVLAGGVDAAVTRLGLAGFAAARSLSTRNDDPEAASRPWDSERDGFVMSEGGAVVMLEEWDSAVERGAPIYAELVGYGATADAYHVTSPAPDGSGAIRSMEASLDQAGMEPADIAYINAHGTSTGAGDVAETRAIKAVFGADAPPVSSTKSMTGHLLGGAGALEAVLTVKAMQNRLLPPTINLENPDPECDLDYVPNTAREAEIPAAMSNSFGFGGHNATLIFKLP